MARQLISTSLAPDCFVGVVMGDLRVKGWESPQVAVDAEPDELDLQEADDVVRISCRGSCEIRLPHGATLEIEAVHGDLEVKLLEETLKIGQVYGSLGLRSIAGLKMEIVHGDLTGRNIDGDLIIEQVLGDADLRQIEGMCSLGDVHGDLNLQNVNREVTAKVRGDARMRLVSLIGAADHESCSLIADGDVLCTVPADAGLRLHLESLGRTIRVNVGENIQTYQQEMVDLDIGSAAYGMTIEAGGDLTLLGQWMGDEGGSSPPMAGYSEQIARQVESQIGQQMEQVSRQLKEQMERLTVSLGQAGFSPEDTERVVEQAMRAGERETARAQEKIRRAQEKLERKLEEAQRKAEQKARASERSAWARPRHTWGRTWPTPPSPPTPPQPGEPVAEEERMLVLKMLEQKKISLEEAEKLLEALEGKE